MTNIMTDMKEEAGAMRVYNRTSKFILKSHKSCPKKVS